MRRRSRAGAGARAAPRLAIALATAAAISCGSSASAPPAAPEPPSPPAAPSPPTGLTAAMDPASFDVIVLRWVPGSTIEALDDTFDVEQHVDDGPWEPLLDAIPPATISARILLTAAAPEAARYGFRIRAGRKGAASDWSGEASVDRGVRPAQSLQVFAQIGLPIDLQWQRGSTQADALRVERQVIQVDGTAAPWAAIASLPVDSTSYVDADLAPWVDGAVFAYRVIYSKRGVDSAPAELRSNTAAPPLPPTALAATAAGQTAVGLDWIPRSLYADKLVVIRDGVDLATLPPDATSYLDAVAPPGIHLYRISARVGPFVNVVNFVADTANVLGFTALPGLPFTLSSAAVPAGDEAARDSAGHFAAASVVGSQSPAVRVAREVAGGLDMHDTALDAVSVDLAPHGLVYGPQDRLHVVYEVLPLGAAPTTSHEWFDGVWHAEEVPLFPQDLAVDGAGKLHAVRCVAGIASAATDAGGAWVSGALPTSRVAEVCAVAAGPDGDERVAYTSPRPIPPGQGSSTTSDLLVMMRSAAGVLEETVPIGAEGVKRFFAIERVFAATANRTLVVYGAPAATGDAALRAVERTDAGWGAPVAIAPGFTITSLAPFAAALAPDGSRLAIAFNGIPPPSQPFVSPTMLATRAADGTWSTSALHPSPGWFAIGFSPAGKLWLFTWETGFTGGLAVGILYEEP